MMIILWLWLDWLERLENDDQQREYGEEAACMWWQRWEGCNDEFSFAHAFQILVGYLGGVWL